jgi:hypothetical protein
MTAALPISSIAIPSFHPSRLRDAINEPEEPVAAKKERVHDREACVLNSARIIQHFRVWLPCTAADRRRRTTTEPQ